MNLTIKTLLQLLQLLIISKCTFGKILLYTAQGVVPRENFTYFTVTFNGNIILELQTKEGDADLYVSEKDLKPGYEPDRYDLHSATCGKDIIYIPRSFNRPIGVGIYGHSSHDFSFYNLDVYMATLQDNLAADFEDVERRYESSRSPTTPVATAAAVAEPQDKMIKPQDKKLNVKLKKVYVYGDGLVTTNTRNAANFTVVRSVNRSVIACIK